jgi:hypothetical protein
LSGGELPLQLLHTVNLVVSMIQDCFLVRVVALPLA